MNIPYEKYLLSVLFLLFVFVPFRAANKTDLSNELESALKLRNQYSLRKEARIDSLKRLLYPSMDDNERFRLYNAIYEEYYTYRFDSAMLYVDKEEQVAMALSHPAYRNLSIIHRSVLLSTSGLFQRIHPESGTNRFTHIEWCDTDRILCRLWMGLQYVGGIFQR